MLLCTCMHTYPNKLTEIFKLPGQYWKGFYHTNVTIRATTHVLEAYSVPYKSESVKSENMYQYCSISMRIETKNSVNHVIFFSYQYWYVSHTVLFVLLKVSILGLQHFFFHQTFTLTIKLSACKI